MTEKFLWFQIALLLNISAALAISPVCGEKEKLSPIYRAFELCEAIRATSDADRVRVLLEELEKQGFCTLLADHLPTHSLLESICNDPVGFVCERKNANLLNSQCQLLLSDKSNVGQSPSYVNIKCSYQEQEAKILENHRIECKTKNSGTDCTAYLRLKYKDELLKIERNLAYTPQRTARLKRLFDRVITKYIALISSSPIIPSEKKSHLIQKIRATSLNLEPNSKQAPSCMNSDPDGPSPMIYNTDNGGGTSMIVFCIGALPMLDQSNDANLLVTIGHEVSHSIDPCTLETEAYVQYLDNNLPLSKVGIGTATYPGLLQCLRGGAGHDGCKGSFLHCNSKMAIDELCKHDEDPSDCYRRVNATPSCNWGATDSIYQGRNPADYQKNNEPVSQINESFSDFMAAEIAGTVFGERSASEKMTDAERTDALVAIATDYAQLHGRCRMDNTNDPHPTGYLRVNRTIMSSRQFRQTFCSQSASPPKKVGTTCKIFE